MFHCQVCGCAQAREERLDEIFQINGKPISVKGIPTQVCSQCGELVFSRETIEKIRRMIHEEAEPSRSIEVQVFAFR